MNKFKKRRLILILIIIVLAVIIGIAVYLNSKNKKIEQTENQNEVEEQQKIENNELSLIDMKNTENAKVEKGKKENISDKLLENKKYNGLEIKNIQLVAENGTSEFTAEIQNNTGKDYASEIVKIIFVKQDGSEYATLDTMLPTIKSGKSKQISAGTTSDIINAYDFKIETAE